MRIHALFMQVRVMLKFSNMAPMMALQLYSEYCRFINYSNHMTVIYLRQIGIFETFKCSFRLFPFPHQPLNWPSSVIGLTTPYTYLLRAKKFYFRAKFQMGRMSLDKGWPRIHTTKQRKMSLLMLPSSSRISKFIRSSYVPRCSSCLSQVIVSIESSLFWSAIHVS